jgi:hypothetical protein
MPAAAAGLAPVMPDRRAFAVTWDYRCPFARNAHEHVIEALRAGAPWEVTFAPFSLGQVHVGEGEPDIWDRPGDDSGLLALQAGVIVRDQFPERFLDAHEALVALRHDRGGELRDEAAVRATLAAVGVDATVVLEAVASGKALEIVRREHEQMVAEHQVWGVPTFVADGQAGFVRLMDRPAGAGAHATRTIERLLDLLTWTDLNELKRPTIPR